MIPPLPDLEESDGDGDDMLWHGGVCQVALDRAQRSVHRGANPYKLISALAPLLFLRYMASETINQCQSFFTRFLKYHILRFEMVRRLGTNSVLLPDDQYAR